MDDIRDIAKLLMDVQEGLTDERDYFTLLSLLNAVNIDIVVVGQYIEKHYVELCGEMIDGS